MHPIFFILSGQYKGFPPGTKCVVHLGACADDEGPLPYDVPDEQK